MRMFFKAALLGIAAAALAGYVVDKHSYADQAVTTSQANAERRTAPYWRMGGTVMAAVRICHLRDSIWEYRISSQIAQYTNAELYNGTYRLTPAQISSVIHGYGHDLLFAEYESFRLDPRRCAALKNSEQLRDFDELSRDMR